MKQIIYGALYLSIVAFECSGQSRLATIPTKLVDQIRKDVGGCAFEETITGFRKNLVGKSIDLNKDGQLEYLVEGDDMGRCISGNKFRSFWVYRKSGEGYSMILGSSSSGLSVLKPTTRGYRDIKETSIDGATTYSRTYRFDGNRYQPNR